MATGLDPEWTAKMVWTTLIAALMVTRGVVLAYLVNYYNRVDFGGHSNLNLSQQL